jgi:sigma-B regulation protein RsbU (phosphoserine phosphatase)
MRSAGESGRAQAEVAAASLLVVDDIEANRDLLARRLKKLGHRVSVAQDGEQALAMLGEQPFDLVLLDITMPGMDGYQVLETMKSDVRYSELPVVMVSAIDEAESISRCLDLGADDYLPKPFDPAVMRARVESSLARKRLRDVQREQLRSVERELEIGRQIQAGFLPSSIPNPPGWEIAARFVPARQVAGDFYDVVPLAGDRLLLVVADVCDKGVGAALYMALFRSLIRVLAIQHADTAAEVLLEGTAERVSDYIATEHGSANMFATAFLAVLEPADGRLVFVNAGHDAPMFARRDGAVERLPACGAALGMLPGQRYRAQSVTIGPGDRLLAFTDGVTEAGGPQAPVGEEGVLALLSSDQGGAAGLLDALLARVSQDDAAVQADDITMLAVWRRPA